MAQVMERKESAFEIKINVDLYIRIRAQAANDAEYSAMQILIAKLLKSDVVHRFDPRVITTTPIEDSSIPGGVDDVKY